MTKEDHVMAGAMSGCVLEWAMYWCVLAFVRSHEMEGLTRQVSL